MFTVEEYPDRESWLVGRTRAPDGTPSIAASEVSILFGEGMKSARALYEEKTHPEDFDNADTEKMYWGRRLEPIIAEEITIRHGWALEDFGRFTIFRSQRWPFLTCTLDRRILPIDARGYGVAECKNSGFFMKDEWDAVGAPVYIQIQGQTQLAVTGYTWGVFPVLLGGCEWRMVEFSRDDEMIELIVDRAAAFCHHVRNRVPPPVDGDESTTNALRRRWRPKTGRVITLPPEAIEWDRAIAKAQKAQKAAAEVEELNKNRIRELMVGVGAEAADLHDKSRRWSFKADKNGQRSFRAVKTPTEKTKGSAA
jgi:predicted phage-related endonuclease